jgi:glycosyltransferase involved in cell wall biosynthesis
MYIPANQNHSDQAIVKSDSKVKILRIIARLNIGGPAIHVVELATGLDTRRFQSLLVSGSENPDEGSMLDYAVSRNVYPTVVPEMIAEFSLKPRDLIALLKLYRLIRQERPHIVETHTAKAGFLGRLAARLAGVPVIIHTYHGHLLHGYYSHVKNLALRRMERYLAYLTKCLIAVDHQVKRDLVAYNIAPAEKIVVIPYGLRLEPFLACDGYRQEFRHELCVTERTKLVGIVGRIFPIKNHRLFLDAAALVAKQEPTVRFVIVGDGALRPEMEEHARRLGIADRVIFTGWRRDLPCIYTDLDVLAVTSINEGTPFSAIEAMAAGCPVVATRVGGLPDLIDDGETGYLVPPGDASAVARGILEVLRDPQKARRMGQEARTRVKDRFTVSRLIDDMERLYAALLER